MVTITIILKYFLQTFIGSTSSPCALILISYTSFQPMAVILSSASDQTRDRMVQSKMDCLITSLVTCSAWKTIEEISRRHTALGFRWKQETIVSHITWKIQSEKMLNICVLCQQISVSRKGSMIFSFAIDSKTSLCWLFSVTTMVMQFWPEMQTSCLALCNMRNWHTSVRHTPDPIDPRHRQWMPNINDQTTHAWLLSQWGLFIFGN